MEEGLVDQTVFNPGYLGLPDFADWAAVPGLGSTLVPIVVVEAFDTGCPRPGCGGGG
ncbi:hypothetical protein AB1207_15255 [Kineococcus endophyticus]|uniref:Uncharacterized protein n=1 Tax=Kineococcus endophyticus TaxID=1181883 RepID=A0ABV3P9R4_9ACTN